MSSSYDGIPKSWGISHRMVCQNPGESVREEQEEVLKVHLHEIFVIWFFSSKEPIWSLDSYSKFLLNIDSYSPSYSTFKVIPRIIRQR